MGIRRALVILLVVLSVIPVAESTQAAPTRHRVVIYAGPVLDPYNADVYTSQPDGSAGQDTLMQSDNATTNFGTNIVLNVGEHDAAASVNRSLIKFDLSSIPSNAIVNSATLSLWQASEASSNSQTIVVYRSLRAWSESQATWNVYSTGNNWQTAGGFGSADAEQTGIGSRAFTSTEANGEKQWSLTASAIQEMVAGTFTNNGFLLKGTSETNDLYRFRSSDDTTAAERPKLVIDYSLPTNTPTNTPTATWTPTNTPTPGPGTYTSQPDSTAGMDTRINASFPTSNYGTETTIRVGEDNLSANVNRALIKFDLSSIPSNATINSATLSLWQENEFSSNDRTLRVYRSLRAWVEGEATWNIYSTGNSWQTAGGFGSADTEQTDIGSRAFTSTEATGEKQWSLTTSAIQEMVAGTFTNNGFLLMADTESDDMYRFYSSDWTTAGERPKLVIEFNTASATASATPTDTPAGTPTDTNTPGPSPTPSETATPTPPNWYRYELSSGKTLTIWGSMSFGEIFNSAAMAALLLVLLVYVIYKVIERWS